MHGWQIWPAGQLDRKAKAAACVHIFLDCICCLHHYQTSYFRVILRKLSKVTCPEACCTSSKEHETIDSKLEIYITAKRKQRSVKTELTNNSWLLSFRNITSIEEINELVQLGGMLQNVQLQQHTNDDIKWNLNESGSYSAKSAYLFQFQGSFSPIDFNSVWRSPAEPNMRFFGWLILHQKTLTAQNLLRRHWPCNWICSLCGEAFEDTNHLFNGCSFFRKVWISVCQWQNIPGTQPPDDIAAWWIDLDQLHPKSFQSKVKGTLLTTWWNVWTERNRRIFQNISSSEDYIVRIVKEDLDLRRSAFQPP